MNIGSRGLAIVKSFEQCRLTAYAATESERANGIWTIGWGHTHGVREGDTCTQGQADDWLVEDVAIDEAGVNKAVTYPIGQPQYDALVSFAYNEGVHALETSTLLHKLNLGDLPGAAAEFPRWIKQYNPKTGQYDVVNGLVRRREMERKLFEALV
jgi:lysozyme